MNTLNFGDILKYAEGLGIFDVALPFLLIFALTFAVLQKISLFGDNKSVNVVVALVLGLLAVRNQALVALLNRFLPNISIFLVVILMLLLLVGVMTGKKHDTSKNWFVALAFVVAIVFVIISFVGSLESKQGLSSFWNALYKFAQSQGMSAIFLIGGLIGIVWLVSSMGGGKSENEKGSDKGGK